MKTCEVCGEEIAPGSAVCPFCETPQCPGPSGRAGGPPVRNLDVEAGLGQSLGGALMDVLKQQGFHAAEPRCPAARSAQVYTWRTPNRPAH